ncbi:capsule assembly Wzi family protein [Salinimicrobium sp. TH3]|uniref:capsule assembly Wzi family protein n=1 Tax=Salinimicrobium sp. TH3 TaxID=2997342 RepID=UPI0022765B27|nr:capsule assembly Wzi family protein [Salinimicrobium sp. TH3]MCY2687780.1 hypothetical protein [Salinimicrobium sp. TH3]
MHPNKIFFLLFFFMFFGNTAVTAQVYYSGEIQLKALIAQDGELPFWMYHNQRGRIFQETDLSGYLGGLAGYRAGMIDITAGAGAFFVNGSKSNSYLDEFYVAAGYSWFEVVLGQRQREEFYKGLSAANESILWSLNSRPLPGLKLGTRRPVYLDEAKRLGFEMTWEEYLLGEDRYVRNAHLHHKRISFIWNFEPGWQLRAGIRHFAIWGGESPAAGKLPESIEDYLRVITGQGGGDTALETDQLNVLGSHLGSYELSLTKQFNSGSLTFLFNSIFEDGSGSRGANFPDGRYGVFFSGSEENKLINGMIYEFYYLKDQSQTLPHLYDNYFNNGVYASGWTNNGRVMGLPFVTPNYYEDYPPGPSVVRIGNNNLLAHHIGVSGVIINNLPYKLLLSYRRNYGHYKNITGVGKFIYYAPDDPRGLYVIPSEVFSAYTNFTVLQSPVNINLELGTDLSAEENKLGAGVSVRYTIP